MCSLVEWNIAMFENLSSAIKEDEELDERLNTLTRQHLQSLKTALKQYFPELKEQEAAFVWNLFLTALNVSDIPDVLQDQFYDHQNHSSARDVFQKMALSQSVAEPGGRRGYSPPPIGMSTKMQNKTNTTLLAFLRLFYALKWIKIAI